MDIFHRHREAQEPELADAMLELALQTPEYRPEALIWKGIDALPNDPKLAFIYLSNAAHALPDRADVHALLGRSILAQGQPELATRYLSAVWQKLPNDPSLRMILWQARSQSANPAELRRTILAHLPDITAPNELNFVLKILAAHTDAPGTVGVVRYLPEEKEIQGWAVDLRNVHAPAALVLEANANAMSVVANVAHPLLTAAGLPATHGGIRIKVPNPTLSVTVRFATGLPLLGSPVSAMPTFASPPPLPDVGKHQPVDVLIPVYDGLEETLECINSAIAARKLNRTPHRLVVVDDATPVPALRKALKVLASKGKITLVQQPVNLGFIRTMNRAMALSPRQDVVWLNADTRVHGNWLDRLRDTAYGSDDIASVTPFTNNGELMSFPTSRVSSPMPTAEEQAELDRLASDIASPAVELETGCGFCLYIKRAALDAVGYLDEVHLSRGYGEETDWCLRARRSGWRHMGATHVFVAHKGGVSFKEEKMLRVAYNNAILRTRFPTAEADYEAFCKRDPLQPARNALQGARLGKLLKWFKSEVTLAGASIPLYLQHESSDDLPLTFSYHQGDAGIVVTLEAATYPLKTSIDYTLPRDNEALLHTLALLIDNGADRILRSKREHIPEELQQLFTALRLDVSDEAAASIDSADCMTHLLDQRAIIADDLSRPDLLHKWLDLARKLSKNPGTHFPCIEGDTPAARSLRTTGKVRDLVILNGLDHAQCAALSGYEKLVSLNPGWTADDHYQRMAALYDLPLHMLDHDSFTEANPHVSAHLDTSRKEASSLTEL
ncbi:glycosyltransferase family 2 protein [Pseudomonas coleopterorum]|uniref:glycosyltransferase family 2 protein n=1 Tax=Pseudomonas coleopterorum TaxID=1605838 RepID=UPI002A6A32B8|nr:glycosyltransferase family 2 protein [Pseudomonas coleopterorum]MDY1015750.1 glycosyltransferase family 2 protein [Pseudomonas coleopterorum]